MIWHWCPALVLSGLSKFAVKYASKSHRVQSKGKYQVHWDQRYRSIANACGVYDFTCTDHQWVHELRRWIQFYPSQMHRVRRMHITDHDWISIPALCSSCNNCREWIKSWQPMLSITGIGRVLSSHWINWWRSRAYHMGEWVPFDRCWASKMKVRTVCCACNSYDYGYFHILCIFAETTVDSGQKPPTPTYQNGYATSRHRKSTSMPIQMCLEASDGFVSAPFNDIFDLLGAYSHRPVTKDDFKWVATAMHSS